MAVDRDAEAGSGYAPHMAGRRAISEHDIAGALAELGLRGRPDWTEIREAYRSAIRAAHPDVSGRGASTTIEAARLNASFAILRRATADGRDPLPPAPAPVSPTPRPATTQLRSRRPGDVYVHLLEAAHEVGDVCYLDPEAGLIQVLLSSQGAAGAHLLIDIDAHQDPPRVAFTLESADASVPPIADVVNRLARHLDSIDIDVI